MPGVKKKSEAQKRLEGTARQDRETKSVEGLEVTDFTPPSHLNEDAQLWYEKNLPLLVAGGMVKQSDLTVFAMAASTYADYLRYSKLLDQEVDSEEADLGRVIQFQRMKSAQSKAFLEHAKSLGLTSVDRSKVIVDDADEANPFDEFLT